MLSPSKPSASSRLSAASSTDLRTRARPRRGGAPPGPGGPPVRPHDRSRGPRLRARRRISQIELVAPGCPVDHLPTWYEKHARADNEAVMLAACPDHHLFRPTDDER